MPKKNINRANFRETGLEVIKEVPWGTHLCQFYREKEDLVEILVPYFKAGLENNELCVWITCDLLEAEEAKDALAKKVKDVDEREKNGQLEIISLKNWYATSGKFDPEMILRGWANLKERALKQGYDALVSGCLFFEKL